MIFGITGDLARRKILPGLYHLAVAGLLPERYRVVGCGRPSSLMTDDEFRTYAFDAVTEFASDKPSGKEWEDFAACLSFAVDPDDGQKGLSAVVGEAEKAIGGVGPATLSPGHSAGRHARRHPPARHQGSE